MSEIVRLKCEAKKYAWGRQVNESLVFQLLQKTTDQPLNEEERYSELWMGTHPSGPSLIDATNQPLKEFLAGTPYSKLPFLFKVLSIDKPLSIQAHPDKKLAKKLHKNFPEIYKDPNHKPELACALTPFQALCGFRPLPEIISLIETRSTELYELLGAPFFNSLAQSSHSNEEKLSALFTNFMKIPSDSVTQGVTKMMERIKKISSPDEFDELLLYINSHFPGDIGVFCAFLLQHVTLDVGESIFLGASLPHCYLSGNIIECMACSDNVVRAGLTPKLKDAETLCSMLDYSQNEIPILRGTAVDSYCRLYPVPVDEFLLYRVLIDDSTVSEYTLARNENSPGILLVIRGNSSLVSNAQKLSISEGSVVFIPPKIDVSFADIGALLEVYYCTCKNF